MNILKKADQLFDKLNSHLSLQVLVAIFFGVFTGVCYPEFSKGLQVITTIFVIIIQPFVAPVIFLTVAALFGGIADLKGAGRISFKSFVYFEVITTVAIIFGMCSALLVHPGRIDRAKFSYVINDYFIPRVNFGWTTYLISNYILFFLVAALVLGIIINRSKYKVGAVNALERMRDFVFKMLRFILLFTPIAAFCGIAYTVGKFGTDTLLPIGKLMAATYMSMFIFVFVGLGGILAVYKISIFAFLKAIKQELFWVLGTSSSSSVLPLLMDRLEIMGYKRSVVSLVTVTGSSFNLAGTSLYLGMAIIFLSQLYNINFSFAELLSILLIMMVTSKGASGIPGTGFIVLATTVSAIHRIPVEGLAILLSIDRFMSEARALTNTIGHAVATVVISRSEDKQLQIK